MCANYCKWMMTSLIVLREEIRRVTCRTQVAWGHEGMWIDVIDLDGRTHDLRNVLLECSPLLGWLLHKASASTDLASCVKVDGSCIRTCTGGVPFRQRGQTEVALCCQNCTLDQHTLVLLTSPFGHPARAQRGRGGGISVPLALEVNVPWKTPQKDCGLNHIYEKMVTVKALRLPVHLIR